MWGVSPSQKILFIPLSHYSSISFLPSNEPTQFTRSTFMIFFIPKARRLTRNIIIALPLPVRLSRIITEQEICHHPIIPTGYSIVVC